MADPSARRIVVPGENIAKGRYKIQEGTFKEGEDIYSSVMGVLDIRGRSVRVIPLTGPYVPNPGDRVVGAVVEVQFLGWMVSIRSPTPGIIKVSEVPYNFDVVTGHLEDILGVGDIIYSEILSVNEVMQVKLTMRNPELRKLVGGRIYTMSPAKIPRLIGRKGSMISMLKQAISKDILVGQNGIIWTRCSDERKAELLGDVLAQIEAEAHIPGLTNRIKALLKEEIGGIEETRKTDSRRKTTRRKRSRRNKANKDGSRSS